jgi:RNA polymerase sigma-70 factor, ECF subfamily
MSGEPDALASRLEGFRAYLDLLARLHLDPRLKGKVDLSGVVQQTLWEGYRALGALPPPGDAQLAALLRRLLANNLADEVRKCYADKRDVGREQSLDADLEASSVRLEAFLAADQSSPEQRAGRNEELLRLAGALERLPGLFARSLFRHFVRGMVTPSSCACKWRSAQGGRSLCQCASGVGTGHPLISASDSAKAAAETNELCTRFGFGTSRLAFRGLRPPGRNPDPFALLGITPSQATCGTVCHARWVVTMPSAFGSVYKSTHGVPCQPMQNASSS